MKIGIVVGSIREGRFGAAVGAWVAETAQQRTDAAWELIDLKDFEVPLLTSQTLPAMARKKYDSPAVQAWSEAIDGCDGFVFVTAEYNHSVPGAFKNAFDSLGNEWAHKPVAFVSYGAVGGIRSVEHWRGIVANFSMNDLRPQVALTMGTDFVPGQEWVPSERRTKELGGLLDAVAAAVAKG